MEGVITQSFKRNLYILQVIGLYPSSEYKHIHRVYGYIMYSVAMLPQFVLTIVKFVKTRKLDEQRHNFLISTGMLFLAVKYLYFLINCDELKTCIDYFDRKFLMGQNGKQRQITHMYVTKSKKICRFFFVGDFGGLLAFFATILLQGYCSNLPLAIWSPFSCKLQPTLYFSIYTTCVIAVLYAGVACAAVDSLVPCLLYLTVGQIKILKEALENLSNVDVEIINGCGNISKKEKMYNSIVRCVVHYNDILEFTHHYEHCFSAVIFFQFTESIVEIGFCCLHIIKTEEFNLNLLVLFNYLFILLLQVYFYCYFGTLLAEENNSISNATYMGKWYEYSVESKKALLILMERSKRPLIITAGKIVGVSLETFTTILKRSYTVICVLKNNLDAVR